MTTPMKKRLLFLILSSMILVLVVIFWYLFSGFLYHRLQQQDFSAILPDEPLVYLQCPSLKNRIEQLLANPQYQAIVRSPLAAQIQQSEWWENLRKSFDDFRKTIFIEPEHIFGRDLAFGVYPADDVRDFPAMVLLCKIDRTARIAERIFSLVSRFIGTVTFERTTDELDFPVYIFEQPDAFPVYYAVVDDVGIVSTSRTLLEHSIQRAMRTTDSTEGDAAPFRKFIRQLPENRVAAGYAEPSRLLNELRRNDLLKEIFYNGEDVVKPVPQLPTAAFSVNTYADRLTLGVSLFSDKEVRQMSEPFDEPSALPLPADIDAHLPLIAAMQEQHSVIFFQRLADLFPDHEWMLPIEMSEGGWKIIGKMIECRLEKAVTGTMYAIPDIACAFEPQNPQLALADIDETVNRLLDQLFPAATPRAMFTLARETYQSTIMSKLRVLIVQEILGYTVTENAAASSKRPYVLLATNLQRLKTHIDELQKATEKTPYLLAARKDGTPIFPPNITSPKGSPVSVFLVNPAAVADFLNNISKTNTFWLQFPQSQYPQFYAVLLPMVTASLKTIPPLAIEWGIHGRSGVYAISQFRR